MLFDSDHLRMDPPSTVAITLENDQAMTQTRRGGSKNSFGSREMMIGRSSIELNAGAYSAPGKYPIRYLWKENHQDIHHV